MSMKNLQNNNIYNTLQKNKKNLLKLSILFILLSASVSAFAWLASNNIAEVGTEANVSSWVVRFSDDEETNIKETTHEIMVLPGMNDDEYEVEAHNEGTTDADVQVEIVELSVLGNDIDLTQPNVLDKFPFTFNLDRSTAVLGAGQTITFTTTFGWEYEDATKYFKADDFYGYQDDFIYYTKNGSDYVEEGEVTSSNYDSLKANLYVQKDDIDTYFGEECGVYQNTTGKACIVFKTKYIANQVRP